MTQKEWRDVAENLQHVKEIKLQIPWSLWVRNEITTSKAVHSRIIVKPLTLKVKEEILKRARAVRGKLPSKRSND